MQTACRMFQVWSGEIALRLYLSCQTNILRQQQFVYTCGMQQHVIEFATNFKGLHTYPICSMHFKIKSRIIRLYKNNQHLYKMTKFAH